MCLGKTPQIKHGGFLFLVGHGIFWVRNEGRLLVPVAARSMAYFCGCSSAEIAGSNPTGERVSAVSVVCCQVEVSAAS
jgi:hypothetical protein